MAKYYSRSKQKFIDIATMTDQYVRYALIQKCKHEPAEDAMFAQQQAERADKLEVQVKHYKKLAEDNFASSVVDLDKIETLEKGLKEKTAELEFLKHHNKQDIETIKTKTYATIDLSKENKKLKLELKDTVSKQAYQVMWDNCEKLKQDYKYVNDRMMMYAKMLDDKNPKGDVKMFSEIPNDDEGREFVQKMKGYLNKESYKLRVKGQYLDEETKMTEGWKVHQFGQPISKSKCLRVYVDVKKE
jgi:hypothetical protein